jgi:RHS repeat-associated protein
MGTKAFTGREWDPETGLYYYRARYYDPKVGRFLSKDPVGFAAGPNYYTYVLDNPVNRVDPSGMYQCTYAIATHTMSCTPNNPVHATFNSSDDFVSGRSGAGCSDCQNNPNRTNVINWGPTPTGTYTIGGPSNGRRNLTPNPSQIYLKFAR